MNRTLLVTALLAVALTACGKKEQAPTPVVSTPAPVAAPAAPAVATDAAKPSDATAAAPAVAAPAAPVTTDKKPEEKK
jgi:hypothetical protein